MKKIPSWAIILFIAAASWPLFFFKLGQSSLVSWDEAWYASISVNLLKTGDLFRLWFNGTPFFDHPPFGFWLMAGAFKIFGIGEFWARAPSAILGILTLVFVFFLGKEISGRLTGFLSAIALSSVPWFISRARSGNLDIFLTFLFVISFYFAFLAQDKKKYLYYLAVSVAFLLLTKTLIPFAIFPVLIYLFWNKKYKFSDYLLPLVIAFMPLVAWFFINSLSYSDFINRYIFIGTRGVGIHTDFVENLLLIKNYLHEGVGIWFWPSVLALAISPLLKKRSLNSFLIFFLTFAIPFIFSPKGQIWHFTPLYPIMILTLVGVASVLMSRIFKMRLLIALFLVIPIVYFSYKQLLRNWKSFINISAYVSDEAILSKEASKYSEKFYIDDNFLPAAAFYSGKIVSTVDGPLGPLFNGDEKFVLITKQWRLDESGIKASEYKILKTDRDKVLLLRI